MFHRSVTAGENLPGRQAADAARPCCVLRLRPLGRNHPEGEPQARSSAWNTWPGFHPEYASWSSRYLWWSGAFASAFHGSKIRRVRGADQTTHNTRSSTPEKGAQPVKRALSDLFPRVGEPAKQRSADQAARFTCSPTPGGRTVRVPGFSLPLPRVREPAKQRSADQAARFARSLNPEKRPAWVLGLALATDGISGGNAVRIRPRPPPEFPSLKRDPRPAAGVAPVNSAKPTVGRSPGQAAQRPPAGTNGKTSPSHP